MPAKKANSFLYRLFVPLADAVLRPVLWLLSSKPVVALYRSLASPDTAAWRWETAVPSPAEKLCVFVTYSPTGEIPERAVRHAEVWRDAGYEILFAIVLDDFDKHPRIPFGHAICRENKGYDFAAWSRALSEVNLDVTTVLATVNDSVFANRNLIDAIELAETSGADVIGFTENREFRWHLQSYAIVFKGDCIHSAVFRRFWQPRLGSRRHVILTYEIQLARTMQEAGYSIATLFPLPAIRNPTAYHWPELLEKGYPYLKRREFPSRRAEWLPLLALHGFDADLIERDCPA